MRALLTKFPLLGYPSRGPCEFPSFPYVLPVRELWGAPIPEYSGGRHRSSKRAVGSIINSVLQNLSASTVRRCSDACERSRGACPSLVRMVSRYTNRDMIQLSDTRPCPTTRATAEQLRCPLYTGQPSATDAKYDGDGCETRGLGSEESCPPTHSVSTQTQKSAALISIVSQKNSPSAVRVRSSSFQPWGIHALHYAKHVSSEFKPSRCVYMNTTLTGDRSLSRRVALKTGCLSPGHWKHRPVSSK